MAPRLAGLTEQARASSATNPCPALMGREVPPADSVASVSRISSHLGWALFQPRRTLTCADTRRSHFPAPLGGRAVTSLLSLDPFRDLFANDPLARPLKQW